MKMPRKKRNAGFSIVELLITMTIMLILLGIVSTVLSRAMGVRARESRKTDALTSAEAALNVISREAASSGYGICTDSTCKTGSNGLITADSDGSRIHFRTNLTNTGGTSLVPGPTAISTNQAGEDVTYFFDAATSSIVRYDPNDNPQTSVVVNKISNVTFQYFDYAGGGSAAAGPNSVPTADTGRIRVIVSVTLDPVVGQPNPASVTYRSDITLRNANYMLRQY